MCVGWRGREGKYNKYGLVHRPVKGGWATLITTVAFFFSLTEVFWFKFTDSPQQTQKNLRNGLSLEPSVTLSFSLVAQMIKNLPAMQETWVWSLGQEGPLEKGMATHSSILAWRIPWSSKEPDRTEQLTHPEFIYSYILQCLALSSIMHR